MVKISGTKQTTSAGKSVGVRKAEPSGSGFKVAANVTANLLGAQDASAQIAEPSSVMALGALIALQTENVDRDTKQRSAERALILLDRIREGILNGRVLVQDLQGLAHAADAKVASNDEQLDAIYEEISLRARIELAKLGY